MFTLASRIHNNPAAIQTVPEFGIAINARLDSNTVRAVDILEGERLRASALKDLIKSGVKHNLAKASPAKARKS